MTGTVCIVYLLLRQEPDTPPTTMTDVSTTFMGIWYLGLGFGLGLGLGLGSGLANPNPNPDPNPNQVPRLRTLLLDPAANARPAAGVLRALTLRARRGTRRVAEPSPSP